MVIKHKVSNLSLQYIIDYVLRQNKIYVDRQNTVCYRNKYYIYTKKGTCL